MDNYKVNSDYNEYENNLNSNQHSVKIDNDFTYKKSFINGIVWIAMFLFSFISLFFIFQTPYYKYYDATDPILIENHNSLIENSKNTFSNNDELLFNNELNSDTHKDQNVIKDNSNKDDLSNKKNSIANNNQSSSISMLLKDSENNNQINKTSKNNVVLPNTIWLINIYSSNNQTILSDKLKEFKTKYSFLQNNYIFYIITINVNNTIKYRISLANSTNQYYKTFQEANAVCKNFKFQGLDCFVSSVDKNNLNLLNK